MDPEPEDPKPSKPSKPSGKKAEKIVSGRRGVATVSAGKSGPVTTQVTPTQQVTVTPTLQAGGGSGTGALASKIDQLIKEIRGSKAKKVQKSRLTEAKKQYRQLRNKAIAKIKADNKDIRARENAKIKKMPRKQRAAARKELKRLLKEREAKLKSKLPTKVTTPGQLSNLLQQFRMLKV